MGYYVNGHGSIRIKAENLDACYQAFIALNDYPHKRGGSWSPEQGQTASWFSWMPQDLTTIPDALSMWQELGFSAEIEQPTGDLIVYAYDSKTGQEEIFAEAAAPFVVAGSEFYWTGEDGLLYQWSFDGVAFYVAEGYTSYGVPVPQQRLTTQKV
jgi:hypothetical protein